MEIEPVSVTTSASIIAVYKLAVRVGGRTVATVDSEDQIAIDADFGYCIGVEVLTRHLHLACEGNAASKEFLQRCAEKFAK